MVKILFWKKGCWHSISNPFVHLILWSYQTVRLLRPLARRRAMTLRPFLVAMRFRKPWTRLRWRFLGWKVRFIFHSSCWNPGMGCFAQGFAHTLGQPCRVRLYAIRPPFVKGFLLEFFAPASKNCRYRNLSTTFCTIYCWKSHFLWKTFR